MEEFGFGLAWNIGFSWAAGNRNPELAVTKCNSDVYPTTPRHVSGRLRATDGGSVRCPPSWALLVGMVLGLGLTEHQPQQGFPWTHFC